MIYDGKNGGTVELLQDFIVIRRQGILSAINQGLKGEKRIPFSSITSVQFKEAGLTTGYIQFGVLGGRESRGGVFDATKDENTVLFLKKAEPSFKQLRDAVEQRLVETQVGSRTPLPSVAPGNIGDELTKLADLKDRGVLSESEFEAQKERLLGDGGARPSVSPKQPTIPEIEVAPEMKMGWGKKLGIGCLGLVGLSVLMSLLGLKPDAKTQSGDHWKVVGGLDDQSQFKFVEVDEIGLGGKVYQDAINQLCSKGCGQVGFFVKGDKIPSNQPRGKFFSNGGWKDYKPTAIYFGTQFTKWDCKRAGKSDAPAGSVC